MAEDGLRLGAVILAAGASRRMGSVKQLIEVEGMPIVRRTALAALEAEYWPVVVVLGANSERIRPALDLDPVWVVENSAWPEGMASSIRAGVSALNQFSSQLDGGLFALCDQPGFTAEAARSLRLACAAQSRSIAAARYGGKLGAPALFLREHFPALAQLGGDEGARAIINADPARVAAVDLPELEVDLDEPQDVRKWKKR